MAALARGNWVAAAARNAADGAPLAERFGDAADGPPGTASLDAVRRVMDTNFLGTVAVTQAMLPLLPRAPVGRIVNVSSWLGSLALSGDPTPVRRDQR